MKENTRKVFDYLKSVHGSNVTLQDVENATGIPAKSVNGSFLSFTRKGWGERIEAEIELEDGSHKKVKFLRLTDEGMAYDPDAEEAQA